MTDMLCFINNYLEDLPKELQLTIMDEVSQLDKQEKEIMETIDKVYDKSGDGDMLYMSIEYLLRSNDPEDDVDGSYYRDLDKTLHDEIFMEYFMEGLADSRKDYIINKLGVFTALRHLCSVEMQEDVVLDMIYTPSLEDRGQYNLLYKHLLASDLKKLFSEKDWYMIYRYDLYNKFIENIDLEGIDTPPSSP